MYSNRKHLSSWWRIVALLVLLLMAGASAYAQYEPIQMVVLNADGHDLTDETGRLWDPEDGVWKPSSKGLSERQDLEVFVTNEVCADSIVAWSKMNEERSSRLVRSFVNEYRQRGWVLQKKNGTYNLADANSIAEEIYLRYGYLVDYWCRENGDTRGVYSVALLLHPQESSRFEMIVLNEKITKYDGEEPNCPLYYKNRTVLDAVEKVHKVQTFKKKRQQAQSNGSWLTFNEHFHIEGSEDQRLIVERFVDACVFAQDFNKLDNRLDGNPAAQALNQKLMDHVGQLEDTAYVLDPLVFAGERFLKTKQRQMRDDLMRDTLEYYRRATQQLFDEMGHWVEYREIEPDTMTFLVPRALWKLLLRYRSFDNLRSQLIAVAPLLPREISDKDTTDAYTISTPIALYEQFAEYIKKGHEMADRRAISSESELEEGYIRHINQLDIYPVNQKQGRRLRIEHNYGDDHAYRRSLKLTPYALDTVLHYRWQMPDARRFYQMRHINYLHDFIHADTTHSEECSCERQMPLQFLKISASPAQLDCPPRRHSNTDKTVSFKPRERGEIQDATYQLSLSFERNRSVLDLRRDSNQMQMDSLVQKAYDITHDLISKSIQQVSIIGISSPEGHRDVNLRLSHQRSQALSDKLRAMGGIDLRYARFEIVKDSIAPWSAVADLIDQLHPESHDIAQRIREAVEGDDPANTYEQHKRIGYSMDSDPVITEALEHLRQVQVSYSYKALMETSIETIMQHYRSGENPSRWPSYYFYVLFNTSELTHAEKVALAEKLLLIRESQVRRFGRDLHPSDSYGLVLPMAANLLAVDAINSGKYDRSILAPFINSQYYQGNLACSMDNDPDTPVKFINLDVVLYNQILMLYGLGSTEAMAEAYELVDILENTPTMSSAFRSQYRPEWLELLLNCQNGDFLFDDEKAEEIRKTNINNFYVVNLARIYQQVDGDLQNIASYEEALSQLMQCQDSLTTLSLQMSDQPAALYFTAVTSAWLAEGSVSANRNELYEKSIDSLSRLFAKQSVLDYIQRLQGDSYLRGLYRDADAVREGMDLYLEAVEHYIRGVVDDVR